jgi:hypothetical protein
MEAFLDRCMSLEKLIVEGLSERALRRTLEAIGVPSSAIASFRTLKLLDSIVRLAQIAVATGINLANHGALLWKRLEMEGTEPAQPIERLFALYDVRILEAHHASDRYKELQDELERFGIMHGEAAAGYGRILDRIYDLLIAQLRDVAAKIRAAAA